MPTATYSRTALPQPARDRICWGGGGAEPLCLLSVHLHYNPGPHQSHNPTFTSESRGCRAGGGLTVGQTEAFLSGGTHLGHAKKESPGEGGRVAVLPELS